MADAAPAAAAAAPTRGGFGGRGRGGDRGGRGRGRGRRGPRKDEEKEWVPVTKLGRLVRAGKIKSMEVQHKYLCVTNVRKFICIHCLSKNIKLSTFSFLNSKMKS
jgi:small subunit ribosomal protein S2e